ncbi:hypothetical protein niasHT_020127 [Heterodera trifolii]|uniref:Uncharacterized protein n=1 Tax=Heterodera trifolii TaxID=157864 RepID=A0ABD2LJV4_9BILA
MDTLPNLDYAEEYGDDGTGRSIELQPTILPTECNLSAANIAEQNTVDNVHLLFQFGIIHWPNFTNCLPNCGLCTQFTSDQFYITYNLVVIGLLLPFISLCGLCGNVLSAFVYRSHGQSVCGLVCPPLFLLPPGGVFPAPPPIAEAVHRVI